MASSKAREAWINAYNEWVNFATPEKADAAASAEIDAAVRELVEAADGVEQAIPYCSRPVRQCGSCLARMKRLKAALEPWRTK